jgi:hypothetical protein
MATHDTKPTTTSAPADAEVLIPKYQLYTSSDITDVSPCIGGSGGSPSRSQKKNRRKDETFAGVLCAWLVEHQIGSIQFLLCE